MCDGTASEEKLLRQERDVIGDGQEGEDRLIGIDWGNQEGGEVRGGLLGIQVWAEKEKSQTCVLALK